MLQGGQSLGKTPMVFGAGGDVAPSDSDFAGGNQAGGDVAAGDSVM